MKEPLSDDAQAFLAFIRDHPGCGSSEIVAALGFDPTRLMYALAELLSRQLIISGQYSFRKVYRLGDEKHQTWYPADDR